MPIKKKADVALDTIKAKEFIMPNTLYKNLILEKQKKITWIDRKIEQGKKKMGPADYKTDMV